MTTPALDRLAAGHWNSRPKTTANPGGLAGGGHVINFPLALADVSTAALEAAGVLNGINASAAAAMTAIIAEQESAKDAAVATLGDIVSAADALMVGKLEDADDKVAAAQAARSGSEAARDLSIAARNASQTARDQAQEAASQAAASSAGHTATSVSELTIATGPQSLVIQPGKKFVPGEWVEIAKTAAPTTVAMNGKVVSYDAASGALEVAITSVIGAGTAAAWTISVSGARGASGSGIISKPVGFNLTGGDEARTLEVDVDAKLSDIVNLAVFQTTADGPISAKSPVALTSAGKLKAISDAGVAGALGSQEATFAATGGIFQVVAVGPTTVLAIYAHANQVYVRAGTVAGTSITWGAEVSCGFGASPTCVAACVHSASGRVVVAYGASGQAASYARSVAVSGTTPTLGPALAITGGQYATSLALSYDPTSQKVLAAASSPSSGVTYVNLLSLSGDTLSAGANVTQPLGLPNCTAISLAYDVAAARHALFIVTSGSTVICPIWITGSTLNTGTLSYPATSSAAGTSVVLCYSTAINKLVAFRSSNGDTTNAIEGQVLTWTGSSFTVSVAQVLVPSTGAKGPIGPAAVSWDPARQKLYLHYIDQATTYGAAVEMSVTSAGVFTVGTPTVLFNSYSSGQWGGVISLTGFAQQIYFWNAPTWGFYTRVFGSTFVSTNAADWLGLAAAAAADGAAVKTIPVGSVVDGFIGLTPTADYFVTKDGGLSATDTGFGKIGLAISATKLLITRLGA